LKFVRRWELLLVALVAPLLAFPPLGRGVIWIALALPALWLVIGIPPTKLNATLLLLLVAVGVSLLASFDILYSAPKALGVILGVALFFAIVRRVQDGLTLSIAFDLYALAGAGLALIGLLGTNWLDKVPALARVTAHIPLVIRGVPGQSEGFQPNAVAGALLLFIPVQLALIVVGDRTWFRGVRIAAFVVTTAVLLLTQSRNGWVSLAVGIAAWALWQPRGARRLRVATVIVLALVAAVAIFAAARHTAEQELGRNLGSDLAGRMELWSRAVAMAQDFPLTGVGMNGFRRVMPVMYPVLLTSPELDVAHAHNHLLTVVAELGVIGLVAYVALWLGVAAMLIVIVRRTTNRQARWTAGGLGAALIAFFVFGTADVIPLGAKVGVVFWMALALVVVLFDRVATSSTLAPRSGERVARERRVRGSAQP